MSIHLYVSLIPEALIASMLPPEKFGSYYAVGARKRTHGEAVFFELDQEFQSDYFNLKDVDKRCVPHANGEPKHSLYISIYRVLEHIPLDKIEDLYLVTKDGRVLALQKGSVTITANQELHLYQELAPVTSMIASNLSPLSFCHFITDEQHAIYVPKLAFFDLDIGDLAEDPLDAAADDLPYKNLEHLRDCLYQLLENPEKPTKTVVRSLQCEVLYRTIKTGFYIGDNSGLLYYPFPSVDELESLHHNWWRSANTVIPV